MTQHNPTYYLLKFRNALPIALGLLGAGIGFVIGLSLSFLMLWFVPLLYAGAGLLIGGSYGLLARAHLVRTLGIAAKAERKPPEDQRSEDELENLRQNDAAMIATHYSSVSKKEQRDVLQRLTPNAIINGLRKIEEQGNEATIKSRSAQTKLFIDINRQQQQQKIIRLSIIVLSSIVFTPLSLFITVPWHIRNNHQNFIHTGKLTLTKAERKQLQYESTSSIELEEIHKEVNESAFNDKSFEFKDRLRKVWTVDPKNYQMKFFMTRDRARNFHYRIQERPNPLSTTMYEEQFEVSDYRDRYIQQGFTLNR